MAFRSGYRISRIKEPVASEGAFEVMQRLLADVEQPIIFDVGAHHGHKARTFRLLFPNCLVYSFEPFVDSFRELKENTKNDPKIHAFDFGLSDQAGTRRFHSNSSSATNSLLPSASSSAEIWGGGLFETKATVEARFNTIDAIMAEMRIPRIDLLKLDVQGAEHLVMQGGASACASGAIRVLYCEIGTQLTYEGQLRFDEAMRAYFDRGFDLFNIFSPNNTPEGRLRQVDAIFTRRDR